MPGFSAKAEQRQRLDGFSPFAAVDSLIQALRRGYRLARQRQRTRRALLHLEAEALRDIGLSSEQAYEEATRPFWRTGRMTGSKP